MPAHFPNDFIYYQINISDSEDQDLYFYYKDAINFIKESIKVFIHCVAGVSRSPSMLIAYLIKEENMKFDKAFDFVKGKRKNINPNKNFLNQLQLL